MLQELGLDPLVIHLDVDYNKIVSRLTARRSCPACGSVYNVVSKPPVVEGLCDVDGVALITRDDDKEETIRQRFQAYESQTQPLIDFFRQVDGRFFTDDGNAGSAEDIAERACHLIRSCE
jgi:adenylate kinase